MSLRLAKEEELDKIFSICLSIKEIYKNNNIKLWNEYYPLREDFEEDIKNDQLYVYTIDDEIVGSITVGDSLLEDGESDKYVRFPCRFMVKSDLQNQGIGTIIMKEMEEMLKKEGIKEIQFLVSNNNPKAMKLYLRQGCVNLGYFKTPWEEEDSYYYLFKKIF